MMMVPIPAAVTDAVMIVNGVCEADPDIGAERADMRAGADALATGTRAGADRADIRAGTGLLRCRSAGKKERD